MAGNAFYRCRLDQIDAPEDIEALVEASESVLLALKINRDGPEAAWVAAQVIAAAKLGERNPLEIATLVVASLQAKQSTRITYRRARRRGHVRRRIGQS